MHIHEAAVDQLSSRDYIGALCTAGSALKTDSSDITAWYLTARAFLGLGDVDVALKNLRSIALQVAEEGRPVLSLSQIKEIEDLGGKTEDLIATIAKLYSAESPRLEESEMAPPPLPARGEIEPWDPGTDPEILKERGKEAMAVAWGESLASGDKNSPLPHIPLLSTLSSRDFTLLVDAFWREIYEKGDIIVEQGAPGDAMYLVAEGQVSVMWSPDGGGEPRELARLGPGAFLGEMSIVSRTQRAASVVARERTVVLFISRKKMEELASKNPEVRDVLVAFCHVRMLENLMRVSPVLSPVPVLRRLDVISLFNTDFVAANQVIIKEGEGAKGLFLVVSGSVSVTKKEGGGEIEVARLGPGDVFGEISLIMSRPSTATVATEEDTALLTLSADDFSEVTREYPELLKGAYDIAVEREAKNNSILASDAAVADDLILV
jgi:CRP-like cAMP-binding protein